MIRPRLFLCSGVTVPPKDPLRSGRVVVDLATTGTDANVHVRLFDLAETFLQLLSPRQEDALEIAAYVYAADCATKRGGQWDNSETTEPWRRDMTFIIPVRDLAFWDQDEVKQLLAHVLQFLSDDTFTFEFRQDARHTPRQQYFEFSESLNWEFEGVDRVLMFSGGLDSLAGAIDTAAAGGNLVLVSHRPVSTQSSRQTDLFEQLRNTARRPMIHVPVWINKDERLGREPSQRTRSFLYATLGMVVAASVKAEGVRFFENGVVSLNLPVADEVIGARASRTTHPHALTMIGRLFARVLGREAFPVDNPYLPKTKKEVIETIVSNGGGGLIAYTCSCAHQGIFQSGTQWHCGVCSQCIDRRIAMLAAGAEVHDPDTDYVIDVFTGPRKEGYERNMAVQYVRHATELGRMSEPQFVQKFNTHITRAVRDFPRQAEAARELIRTHKRHGEAVQGVIERQLARQAGGLLNGRLAQSSMLALIGSREHLVPSWTQYAERVTVLLRAGLPIACRSHKPKDEPHLQEVCDGILKAQHDDLVREFPFMRWGSGLTKPDWSVEERTLWIELKYVRKKTDLRPISEDIAADITKYGDNGRHCLFVVYDPGHLITDEKAFSEPIGRREGMLARLIR
ncbi:MAG TPA: hypothetical protein VD866_26855 [Urbifossiella sp.]|nr:hypothetical protein [Urbifossiella sp.]